MMSPPETPISPNRLSARNFIHEAGDRRIQDRINSELSRCAPHDAASLP